MRTGELLVRNIAQAGRVLLTHQGLHLFLDLLQEAQRGCTPSLTRTLDVFTIMCRRQDQANIVDVEREAICRAEGAESVH